MTVWVKRAGSWRSCMWEVWTESGELLAAAASRDVAIVAGLQIAARRWPGRPVTVKTWLLDFVEDAEGGGV